MKIDSHHHFWNYDPLQYAWIDERMEVLRRSFGIDSLRAEIGPAGVVGVISVQARQTVEECRFLLDIASQASEVLGVVGWLPLQSEPEELLPLLEQFSANPLFKGVRHVVQDEPDDRFLLTDKFCRGIACLQPFKLIYDLLLYARQLPAAIELVDRFPQQTFVLDHISKPAILISSRGEPRFDTEWAQRIRALARRPNVTCKFSGIVTEIRSTEQANAPWTTEIIQPYWDVVMDAFGPERTMFGSDWPVCLLQSSYHHWVECVTTLASSLTADEQYQFWFANALRTYNLSLPDAVRSIDGP